MITKTRIYTTPLTEPHRNLAVEEALMRTLEPDEAILYLWQNKHTVVIGSGQNAWRECHVKLLEDEGGTLARRSTGGGAVYHDLGNLNFSLIVPHDDYDIERQSSVVLSAVRSVGIQAEKTGRNDLTVDGRKFSGNAFRVQKDVCLQHGTLLLRSDMERVARYLNVSADKLKSKGVKSVPSRVINLCELADVNVAGMCGAMAEAFEAEYGPCPGIMKAEDLSLPFLPDLIRHYSDWNWNYGASPQGGENREKRFPWGNVDITFRIVHGDVESAVVFTDSMDETLKERLEAALPGTRWTGSALYERMSAIGENDIALWLKETV